MGYSKQDFDNPLKMFEMRTRQVRTKIQTLEFNLSAVKHPISKAIILNELHNTVDDYIERKLILTGDSSARAKSLR